MKSSKVFLGMLVALAAGGLAGILFAPAKGSKTRNNILHESEDYVDAVKVRFNEFVNDMTQKFENTWHKAEKLVAQGEAKKNEIEKNLENMSN